MQIRTQMQGIPALGWNNYSLQYDAAIQHQQSRIMSITF